MHLRELWRKPWRDEHSDRHRFSLHDHLTHTGEYHLQRLQKLLELRFGKTYRDDDEASVRAMIHFASRVQNQDIQRELLLFYLNCSPSVQDFLRDGDLVDADHYIHRRSSDT